MGGLAGRPVGSGCQPAAAVAAAMVPDDTTASAPRGIQMLQPRRRRVVVMALPILRVVGGILMTSSAIRERARPKLPDFICLAVLQIFPAGALNASDSVRPRLCRHACVARAGMLHYFIYPTYTTEKGNTIKFVSGGYFGCLCAVRCGQRAVETSHYLTFLEAIGQRSQQ